MNEFADDNFRFDEKGIKLSKQVENSIGKGEIAHNEQFLLFSQCFQRACFPGASKGVIVWEWVNSARQQNFRQSKLRTVSDDKINVVEKIEICFEKGRKHCGKRRKCWLPAFSPFSTMISKGFFHRIVKSSHCLVDG